MIYIADISEIFIYQTYLYQIYFYIRHIYIRYIFILICIVCDSTGDGWIRLESHCCLSFKGFSFKGLYDRDKHLHTSSAML
jgi:hypothetical protein